jgi:hypothetical protein
VSYRPEPVRSYRVCGQKIRSILDFEASVSIEDSVVDMVNRINALGYRDFENPRYYNIRQMTYLEEAAEIIAVTGSVFECPQKRSAA